MPSLAGMYRRLMFTYPTEYRESHHREIVGTLVEASSDDQRAPRLREAWALFIGGLRVRALQADRRGPRGLWTDGLRMGAVLSLAALIPLALVESLGGLVQWPGGPPPLPNSDPTRLATNLAYPIMLALTILTLVRRPRRWGLLLVAPLLLAGGHVIVSVPALRSSMGMWALVGYLPVVVPCAVSTAAFLLAGGRGRSGSWSWWWAAALLLVPVFAPLLVSSLLLVLVLSVAALVIRDTRLGVAALVVSVVSGLGSGAGLVGGAVPVIVTGGLAAICVIVTLVAGYRLARVR